jgi:hypothetical protein
MGGDHGINQKLLLSCFIEWFEFEKTYNYPR